MAAGGGTLLFAILGMMLHIRLVRSGKNFHQGEQENRLVKCGIQVHGIELTSM